MHPPEELLHQTCARPATTASPGLARPLQRTEEQQGTGVPKVITVLGAPQRHCRVPRDITATRPGTVASQTACPVLQVLTYIGFLFMSVLMGKQTIDFCSEKRDDWRARPSPRVSYAAPRCFSGLLCVTRGLSFPSQTCPAGSYCPGGGSGGRQASILCPPGNKCPPGSERQVPCSPGTYQDLPGQVSSLSAHCFVSSCWKSAPL